MVMALNPKLKQLVAERVDISWQSDVLAGLELMDPQYLFALTTHPEWLPSQSCLFSAFNQSKSNVQYVLLGESPYPRLESANGYAFWDAAVGDLWSEKGLSKTVNRATSLRNFIKMLLAADGTLQKPFAAHDIAALPKDGLVKTLDGLFTNLLDEGFLLLNASLVWSSDKPVRYHAKHWYPFINYIMQCLLPASTVFFLLFGKIAHAFSFLPEKRCLTAEHPYVLSFIENQTVLAFFQPLSLLRAKDEHQSIY